MVLVVCSCRKYLDLILGRKNRSDTIWKWVWLINMYTCWSSIKNTRSTSRPSVAGATSFKRAVLKEVKKGCGFIVLFLYTYWSCRFVHERCLQRSEVKKRSLFYCFIALVSITQDQQVDCSHGRLAVAPLCSRALSWTKRKRVAVSFVIAPARKNTCWSKIIFLRRHCSSRKKGRCFIVLLLYTYWSCIEHKRTTSRPSVAGGALRSSALSWTK